METGQMRPLGQQRQQQRDHIYQDLNLIGVENTEKMTKNREQLEEVIIATKGLN